MFTPVKNIAFAKSKRVHTSEKVKEIDQITDWLELEPAFNNLKIAASLLTVNKTMAQATKWGFFCKLPFQPLLEALSEQLQFNYSVNTEPP